MSSINSKPDYGSVIAAIKSGIITEEFQIFFDELEQVINQIYPGPVVTLPSYTVATVPDVSMYINGCIIVSDESGGRTIATSDGSNWRRVSDGAIIS